ncbi:MAG TPA: NAD(P)-dependent oxidoreductase [Ohtaekwangia sp.]|uniref:NAD(P)-dependent oxidoreductase n=1 Tax=Ohtaekwangia sp. TaxID=2066019 RepID=UPI002F957891
MTSPACLIIDSMHESLFPMLTEIGWQAVSLPAITRDEIKTKHHGFDGLIVRSKTTIDRDLLGENPTIKFVARAGAGIDNIDVEYLKEKGIQVLHASEGNRDAVGEYTAGALLSLMRNIPRADRQVRDSIWEREGNRGEELMGKMVGIIGYGNMGHAFAKRLSGFACNVLAYDKYKSGFSDAYCKEATMEELFVETDILSLHIPLTGETRKLVNVDYLNRFKKKIILVNTARGEIVSLTDITRAIQSGQVRGAVLDVLENEKLNTYTPEQQAAFNILREKTNVILTPHIAGWTYESHVKINVALTQKIKALGLAR